MRSSGIPKRSISLPGYKTSVSLENEFWQSLRDIAEERGKSLAQLITDINTERNSGNLASAIRIFIVRYYRDQFNSRAKGKKR